MQIIEIIDLLNLIHKDQAPNKIIYGYCEYLYSDYYKDYINQDGMRLLSWLFKNEIEALSKTVEIVTNRPRTISEWGKAALNELDDEELSPKELQTYLNICINTQQDLIKAVNYLLEKSDINE